MENSQLILSLRALRLGGMADALEQQFSNPTWLEVPFEERLEAMMENEESLRKNRKIYRILKSSNLRYHAAPEEITYTPSRNLDKALVRSLLTCQWVESGTANLLITGATGTGKTWLACAFGMAAARKQLSVGYRRVGLLLEELETAHHDGERRKKQDQLRKYDLLVLDDLGLERLSHNAVIDLLNVIDDRVGRKSTIIAAQMPTAKWHEYLGGGAEADAIMDRLIHTSQTLELKGPSLRAKR